MDGCRQHGNCTTPHGLVIKVFMHVGRLHRAILERWLLGTGVYRSQHQLLMYISAHPNASQKEIAGLLQVSTATVAVSLKKLEQGGYIHRAVDKEDNRFNQICITDKGRTLIEGSIRHFEKVEQVMFSGFTREEEEILKGYLERMEQNLMTAMCETEREETT